VYRVVELPPQEARRKLAYLQVRLWHEQYSVNWLIQDLRPEVLLKNELVAYWEGRVSEVHGWTNIIGQIVDAIVTPIRNALTWFWNSIIQPGLEAALNGLTWIAERARDLILAGLQLAAQVGGWLYNAISNAVNWIGEAVSRVWSYLVETVSGALEAISRALAAIPQAIAAAFQSAISYIATIISDVGRRAVEFFTWLGREVYEAIMGAVRWVWDRLTEIWNSFWNSLVYLCTTASKALMRGEWQFAFTIAVPYMLTGGSASAVADAAGTHVAGTGIAWRSLGRFINRLFDPRLITTATVGTLIYTAIEQPSRQFWAKAFRTGLIDIETAMRMMWRGSITREEFMDICARHGYSDRLIQGYMELSQVIPSISDLIRFAVREAYPVATPEEQLAEMRKWAGKQGLSDYWVDCYWTAHWNLPSFGDVREAFWRGIIDADDYWRYILKHDYRPDPWPGHKKSDQQIMFELSFRLPTAIEQRWMLRWGLLDYAGLVDLMAKSGLHPQWLNPVAQAIMRQMLTDERTRLLNDLRILYREGQLTIEEFTRRLRELYYSEPEIALIIEASNIERHRRISEESLVKVRDATRADYSRAFRLGIITEPVYRSALERLGYTPETIDLIISLDKTLIQAELERERLAQEAEERRRIKAATRSDLSQAFKLDVIDEATYRERLKALGYPPDQIDMIVSIDKEMKASAVERELLRRKQYEQREAARLTADEKNSVKTALVNLYVQGLMPLEALTSRLTALGWTPQEIALLTEAARLRLDLRLKELGENAAIYEYRTGKISLEQLAARLSALGFSDTYVQAIIELERARTKTPVQSTPEEEARAFGRETAIKRYVAGLTTEVELEQELRLLGYGPAEIARIRIYAELQRDYETFKEIIDAARTALRRGRISEAALTSLLTSLGVPTRVIERLISVERLRIGYGVTEAA